MPDPLKTIPYPLRKARLKLLAAAACALAIGLGVSFGPAQAAPALNGLTGPGLDVVDVGYKRYKKRRYDSYLYQDSGPDYQRERYMPYGGSDEILELQRRFPQTNWPPSMRYF